MNKEIVIPTITGLLGFFSGFLLPFVQWYIEKLKLKRENRILLISTVRKDLSANNFDVSTFKDSVSYSRLKEYILSDLLSKIEPKDGAMYLDLQIGDSRSGIQNELLDCLVTLEKKWKLI